MLTSTVTKIRLHICLQKIFKSKGRKVFLSSKRGCHHLQTNQRPTLLSNFEVSLETLLFFCTTKPN